jgi:hypothetical protein
MSRSFQRDLTPSNIKVGFRKIGIWPLNYDALTNDMPSNQAFEIHGEKYENLVVNMMSLSQECHHPFGDIDEHVSDIQEDDGEIQENMEVVVSNKPYTYFAIANQNETNQMDMVEGGQAMGRTMKN